MILLMSNQGKPWLNNSGCPDPTFYEVMKRVQKEQRWVNRVDEDAHTVITTIKNILDLAGFELVDRIQIRHKKTGKYFR